MIVRSLYNKNVIRTLKKTLANIFIFIVFLSFFHTPSIAQNSSEPLLSNLANNPKLKDPNIVLEAFSGGAEKARFIIMLKKDSDVQDSASLNSETAKENRRLEVERAQDNLLNKLQKVGPEQITNKFKYIYGFSVEVTLEQLEELLQQEEIEFVEEDSILHPHLAQGIPLMNASIARSSYNGEGTAIAICDTGIDYTHSSLGGGGFPNSKVVGGYDCGEDDNDPIDEQGHGTGCAGIAAGDNVISGDYIGGVAYNAKLYGVKISRADIDHSAYTSDMIEGWDWCITHQYDDSSNPIMIISTSFGGGRYFSSCDSESTAMTAAAANAVTAGMTLFVSSGNDGYCDSIGWPACISHIISVGAVYDADIGRNPPSGYVGCIKNGSCVGIPGPPCDEKWYVDEPANEDQVPTYSNSASFLDLLAPSNWATTTELGGGYWDTANGFGGTSAACPYAAGVAACLQNAAKVITGSFLTPNEVESALIDNGDLITDGKVSITKPRVNLGAAVNAISVAAIALLTPADGAVLPPSPPATFSWESDTSCKFKIQFSPTSLFPRGFPTLTFPRRWMSDTSTETIPSDRWARCWEIVKRMENKNGIVYWRVIGKASPLAPIDISETRSFTIE